MITEADRDKALNFLARTDIKCARAKAFMIGLELQEKTVLGMIILDNRIGTTEKTKEAISRTSDEYKAWREKYENAVYEYEVLRNKRNTAEIAIECWRSENANRRQAGGNL